MPLNKIIKEIKKDMMMPKEKYFFKINECVSKQLSELTYLFLTDKRQLYDKKY